MMTKIQAWINISIATVLVGELLLSPFRFLFSVPLMFIEQTWIIQASIGFCIVLINLKIQNWPIARRIIALVVALSLFCWGAISFSGVEQLRNTAQLGENRYYFTTRTEPPDLDCDFYCNFNVPALYKCNSIGLECETVFHDDFMDVLESGLVVDKDANEIQLFLSYSQMPHGGFNNKYGLAYVYGKQPRFIMGSNEFNGSIYYLSIPDYLTTPAYYTTPQGDIPLTYVLYKCDQDSTDCRRLPFEYAATIRDNVEIHISETGKLTIDDEELIYTYDIQHSQADCYIAGCTLKDE